MALAVAIAIASQLFASSPVSAVVSWQIADDSVSLGLTGVSPYVERAGSVDRLWRSGGLAVPRRPIAQMQDRAARWLSLANSVQTFRFSS